MRIENTVKTIPAYKSIYDENGELFNIEQTGETVISVTELFADEGKRFVRISDNALLGSRITLGTEDAVENYIEA